ncbi:hypothetical protein E1286_43855 [Nonomuraea terrae]|uniref:Uncharacterized protein n=1 Tax=Nonomuraea terrae TaxID=2530383 RepID=A0A4R4XLX8_9ACTN|nr:hypothetical protein [Nonomuraea terrae]TDD32191.1 hypothetical protein E1286_43855 [Nonomuraea terrae]
MTWNSGPCVDDVPEAIVAALDAINAQVGWPRGRPDPCVGHMVSDHRPVDGIDVSVGRRTVHVSVAGVTVGVGPRWGGIGNAAVRCVLPHASALDSPWVTALHQGGAINAFQQHLLTLHGTHRYSCSFLSPRDRWCRICQAGRAA